VLKCGSEIGTRSEQAGVSTKAGLLPETEASLAHNGSISLDAPQGIGEKQFSLNAPASSLKKSCWGHEKQFPLVTLPRSMRDSAAKKRPPPKLRQQKQGLMQDLQKPPT
jgi:hypothetical protein